jgi:vacuolar-type H+-ATPase subunit E/Vma4
MENKENFSRFLNDYNEKEKIINEIIRNATIRAGEYKEKVRKEALSEKEAIVEKAKMEAEEKKREGLKKLEEEIKEGRRTIESELESLSEELIKNILITRN